MTSQSRGRLDGKIAIITGAASGVGASAVRLFLAEGAYVVGGDYRAGALRNVHDDGEETLRLVQADVRVEEQCRKLVEEAVTAWGRVDVLFNNAGVTVRGALQHTDDETWDAAMDVNLRAVLRLTRAAVPHMGSRGAIVNNASITALEGLPGVVAYSTAKGGVAALTRALAIELAPSGIRVNAVCPGAIDSPMTQEWAASRHEPAAELAKLAARQPFGRLVRPIEVARAALFLASDDASAISGVLLAVDGGRHAAGPGLHVELRDAEFDGDA